MENIEFAKLLVLLAVVIAFGAAMSGCASNRHGVLVPLGSDTSDPEAYR